MGHNPVDDITEGLERIQQMYPEDHVHEVQAPKNPIEAMEAAGIDMDDVREAVGGHLDNILHAEQVDQASWRLKVRRITRSGTYTETITVTANSDVLAENAEAGTEDNGEATYRLTPQEAAQEVAQVLGNHLVKVEAVRGDGNLIALHIRENHDTQAVHRIFADLNSSLHQGGWHATMRENMRWTMSPMAGAFLERRATLRAADKGEHLYPPAYYAARSTEAALRSSEVRDNAPTVSEGAEERIDESDARKRAFKSGYPMTPQHALAQSTDTIMYPAIGDNDKVRDGGGKQSKEKESKTKKDKPADQSGSILNKAVSSSGDFL